MPADDLAPNGAMRSAEKNADDRGDSSKVFWKIGVIPCHLCWLDDVI